MNLFLVMIEACKLVHLRWSFKISHLKSFCILKCFRCVDSISSIQKFLILRRFVIKRKSNTREYCCSNMYFHCIISLCTKVIRTKYVETTMYVIVFISNIVLWPFFAFLHCEKQIRIFEKSAHDYLFSSFLLWITISLQ